MRPINLIPQDQRRRAPSESSGKGTYAVLAGLAVLVAMVAFYVLSSNQVTERENEAAVAAAEATRLEAEAANEASYTDFAAIAQTRVSSVMGVAATRFDWERMMREVSLIIPSDSWLLSADASVAPAGDEADPAAAAVLSTGPSATFVGCTPRQSDVARMMVRLRQMHRVSDVTLNESGREGADQPATMDGCGSLYQFDVTVTFDPTQPVDVAPRGAERVPVSLGGGS